MKKSLLLLLMIAVLLVTFTACQQKLASQPTGETTGQPATEPEVLVIGVSNDVTTWNPYARNQLVSNAIQKHVFEPLINVQPDLKSEPGLATSWEANGDGTVWTIKLREGVKFHNGKDFVADDVVFSLDTVLETATGWVDSMATIESYKAIDKYTVEITCNTSDVLLPNALRNLVIISKETCDGKGLEFLETNVVGTGKYKLVEYNKDDKVILERNEEYWGDKPEFEKVVFKTISNDGTRIASLMSNEIDFMATVPVKDAEVLKNSKDIKVISYPSISPNMLAMVQYDGDPSPNSKLPMKSPDGSNPLNVRDVREAMAHAINEKEIVDKILSGYGSSSDSLIPEGFNGYNPEVKKYAYDPDKAMQLLDSAGYKVQSGGALDGYRFEITLDCQEKNTAVATAIASYLGKVGIKCNPNPLASAIVWDYIRMYESYQSHFIISSWSEPSGESALIAKDVLYSAPFKQKNKDGWGGANRGYYVNKKVDKLIEQALSTVDYAERDKIMQEVWKIAYDEVAYLTLFTADNIYAVNSKFDYSPRNDEHVLAWSFKKVK